jgi:hypothetical protein
MEASKTVIVKGGELKDLPGWYKLDDGFFEHDAPHLPSVSSTHPGVVSEKALA